MCTPQFDNCDGTPLNGCEADLWSDPLHCGRCRSICEGVCSRRGCHEPEDLSDQSIRPMSPFAVTADYLYMLTGDGNIDPHRLWRFDKLGLSPQILIDNLDWSPKLAVVSDRIYLYGGERNLWSGTEQGDFIDEGLQVESLASSAGVVYADRQGTIVARREGETTWTPQPWLASESDPVSLWPIDVANRLVVMRDISTEFATHRYELFLVDRPDLPDGGVIELASGSGNLVRLRSANDSVYWLIQEESGLFQLLRRDIERNSPVQVLETGINLVDFALDSSFVYLTRSLTRRSELEVITAYGAGEKLHLGARFDMQYPEAVGDYLWFIAWQDRLQRVALNIEEL